jgi:hypothetical protein
VGHGTCTQKRTSQIVWRSLSSRVLTPPLQACEPKCKLSLTDRGPVPCHDGRPPTMSHPRHGRMATRVGTLFKDNHIDCSTKPLLIKALCYCDGLSDQSCGLYISSLEGPRTRCSVHIGRSQFHPRGNRCNGPRSANIAIHHHYQHHHHHLHGLCYALSAPSAKGLFYLSTHDPLINHVKFDYSIQVDHLLVSDLNMGNNDRQ